MNTLLLTCPCHMPQQFFSAVKTEKNPAIENLIIHY